MTRVGEKRRRMYMRVDVGRRMQPSQGFVKWVDGKNFRSSAILSVLKLRYMRVYEIGKKKTYENWKKVCFIINVAFDGLVFNVRKWNSNFMRQQFFAEIALQKKINKVAKKRNKRGNIFLFDT